MYDSRQRCDISDLLHGGQEATETTGTTVLTEFVENQLFQKVVNVENTFDL